MSPSLSSSQVVTSASPLLMQGSSVAGQGPVSIFRMSAPVVALTMNRTPLYSSLLYPLPTSTAQSPLFIRPMTGLPVNLPKSVSENSHITR